jgi:hypothetical protein
VANSPLPLQCEVTESNTRFSVELDKYNPWVKQEPFEVTAGSKTLHTDTLFYNGFSEF